MIDANDIAKLFQDGSDERTIETWRPSLSTFLARLLVLEIATLPFGLVIAYPLFIADFNPVQSLPAWHLFFSIPLIVLLLVNSFTLGGLDDWLIRRHDIWTLQGTRLLFHSPLEDENGATLPFIEMKRIKRVLWWSTNIELQNGQVVSLRYLSNSAQIRDTLQSCVDAANKYQERP